MLSRLLGRYHHLKIRCITLSKPKTLFRLFNETVIVLGAKHGESPIDPTIRRDVASAALTNATKVPLASITADTAAYVWLQGKANQAKAAQVEADFKKINSTLNIQNIWAGAEVTAAGWGNPLTDPRVPDIIIQVRMNDLCTLYDLICIHF